MAIIQQNEWGYHYISIKRMFDNDIQVAVAIKAEEFVNSLTLDFEIVGEQSGFIMVVAPKNC